MNQKFDEKIKEIENKHKKLIKKREKFENILFFIIFMSLIIILIFSIIF